MKWWFSYAENINRKLLIVVIGVIQVCGKSGEKENEKTRGKHSTMCYL
jgi:hypothetical protein